MTVKMTKKLTSSDQKTLPEALIYRDKTGRQYPLTKQDEVLIHQQKANGPRDVILQWKEDQGLLLQVRAGEAYARTYKGVITWTLTEGP
ncbi:hypothetical protein DN395_00675 [Bacillus sp. AR18-7]|nr:hypothetical protein DN395_00675 [Bacillus sp. AR18-7]